MRALFSFRNIADINEQALRAMKVHPHQERFVASVEQSLADTHLGEAALMKAAVFDGQPIGFVLLYPYDQEGLQVVNIVRFLIGAPFQGMGYGSALMTATLAWIDSVTADRVRVATAPDNHVALALYHKFGFREEGRQDGQIILALDRPR